MGVATDHLGVDPAAHVVDVEQAPLGGDLGREHDLEEEVAELAGEHRAVGVGDRVHDLVGLFDDVGLQTLQRLLAVPGTAVGRPQAGGKRAQRCEGVVFAHGAGVYPRKAKPGACSDGSKCVR